MLKPNQVDRIFASKDVKTNLIYLVLLYLFGDSNKVIDLVELLSR